MRALKSWIGLMMAWTFCTAPALGASVKVNRLEPGEQPVYGAPKLHVKPFEGIDGVEIQNRIKNALQQADRGSTNSKIPFLQEGIEENPYTLVATAEEADAIVSGSTTYRHAYKNTTRKNDYCTKLEVYVATQWQIVSATDARTIFRGSVDAQENSSRECGKDRKNRLPSPATLAGRAIRGNSLVGSIKAVASLVSKKDDANADGEVGRYVASMIDPIMPHWTVHSESLKSHKENKDIVKLAADGDWEQAVCIWRKATDPESLYNLGVLYEVKGWYPQSIEAMQRSIDAGGKKYAEKGLERVQQRQSTVQAMADGYGLAYTPLQPPENDICVAYE